MSNHVHLGKVPQYTSEANQPVVPISVLPQAFFPENDNDDDKDEDKTLYLKDWETVNLVNACINCFCVFFFLR